MTGARKGLRAPMRAKPTPGTRIDHVLADVRDRIHANAAASPGAAGDVSLGTLVDVGQQFLDECRAAGNEPLHFDPSVACSFRESMLALACLAARAVVEHDRRALGARQEPKP